MNKFFDKFLLEGGKLYLKQSGFTNLTNTIITIITLLVKIQLVLIILL